MLNDCLTPMGKRKFLSNILNPICDEVVLQREYNITEYFLSKYDDYNCFLKSTLSTIKDVSKTERQIFLRKISPKSFYNLYNNILTIKQIYEKMEEDLKIKDYLSIFEPNILNVKNFCEEISQFINSNIDLFMAKDLEQMQYFEVNFIKNGIDEELDKKTATLKESEYKLAAISEYLSSLIENKEKKSGKGADYVKIHETEKNSFSLITTSRRCKLLQDALPNEKTKVMLYYNSSVSNKQFEFEISKAQFDFEKQSASNNFILHNEINNLCKNISNIKISMKDLITHVYNKFVSNFEKYQTKVETIINFVTIIDVLYTKSAIAKKYNYCKPNIVKSEKSFVDAKKLRH
jgi:DNA mismatch repair protein MutS